MLASIEFAVAEFGVPLVMVLAHERCGAVAVTVEAVERNAQVSGHLMSLVRAITPAVIKAKDSPGDLLDNAVRTNLAMVVAQLQSSRGPLAEAREAGKLRFSGGYYNLQSGIVDLIVA